MMWIDFWRSIARRCIRFLPTMGELPIRLPTSFVSGTGRLVPVPPNPAWGPAVAGLTTLALLFWRAHDGITTPQFYAEDGSIFFLQNHLEGIVALFIPVNDYHLFVSRLVAWIASPFGAVAAPGIYVAASMILEVWAACSIATARIEYAWLLGAALIAVPHSGESFATLETVQWFLAPAMALALVTAAPHSSAARINQWISVSASCCSGPFCIFALPLALMRVARDQSRYGKLLAAMVFLGALVQGVHVVTRVQSNSRGDLGLIEARASANFALTLIDRWFGQLSHGAGTTQNIWQAAMVSIVGIAAVIAWQSRLRRTTFSLLYLFAAVIVAGCWWRFHRTSASNFFTSPQFGDGYFYLPRLFVIWSLILLIADVRRSSIVGVAAIGAIAVSCSTSWIKPAMPHLPWKEDARRIDRGEAVLIEIVPNPWRIELPANYKLDLYPIADAEISKSTCQGSIDILKPASTPGSVYDRYAAGGYDDKFKFGMMSYSSGTSEAGGRVYLNAEGWLVVVAKSGSEGASSADEVFLALTAPDGTRKLYRAPRSAREDITKVYKQLELPKPGYRIFVDVGSVRGRYKVEVIAGHRGKLTLCVGLNGLVNID